MLKGIHTIGFAILLLLNTFIYSQDFIHRGICRDKKTQEALPGVAIRWNKKAISVSGINGDYRFSSSDSVGILEAELVGYQKASLKLKLNRNDSSELNVLLETSNQVLDEVVVSAGRYEQKLSDVTVSMEIIKPSLVENKSTVALDQIVNQVPGINVSDGQASIRAGSGFSYGAGSRVLMLVDEMPMISADAADIKWNYLPIENISQIEVIKGASSALFGSSALNGVINMRTAYAKDKPITSIQTYYGRYDNPRRASLNWWKGKTSPSYKGTYFSHLQKFGGLDLVLGGNFYQDDGFRYLASEMRGRATVNIRYNFKKVPGLSIGVNGNIMQVQGGLFFLWHNDSLAYTPRDSSIQAYNNLRWNVDPFIVYHHEKFGKHSLRTRFFRTVNVNDKNQSSTADLTYAEYQGQKRFKNELAITLGIVNMQQQIYSDSLYGRHTGTNWAGYLQADKKWKKLTVSFGLRCESFKVDTSKTKGEFRFGNTLLFTAPFEPVVRLGINYQLFKYTYLRASYGQGYRFPSVAEKYIQTNVNGLNIWPNANLKPERGQSAELAVKQGFGIGKFKGFLDVAGFWMEYDQMMDFIFRYFYKDPNSLSLNTLLDSSGFQSVNILKTQITGVDISLNGNGKIGPIDISAMIGYTYAMPINLSDSALFDTTGTMRNTRLLKYRNPELFKGDLQLEYKGFAIGWSARFTSYMRNIDKRFEEPVIYEWVSPSFPIYNNPSLYVLPGLRNYRKNQRGTGDWMHDFRMSYQFSEHFKLAFICNNVFNYEFMSRPGYIEAPRTFILQANIKF